MYFKCVLLCLQYALASCRSINILSHAARHNVALKLRHISCACFSLGGGSRSELLDVIRSQFDLLKTS